MQPELQAFNIAELGLNWRTQGKSLIDRRSFPYKGSLDPNGDFPLWMCGGEELAGKTCGLPRFHIMNVAHIEELRRCVTGVYVVRVSGGKKYTITRAYKNNLRFLADI
jgi:hypothetical protein